MTIIEHIFTLVFLYMNKIRQDKINGNVNIPIYYIIIHLYMQAAFVHVYTLTSF